MAEKQEPITEMNVETRQGHMEWRWLDWENWIRPVIHSLKAVHWTLWMFRFVHTGHSHHEVVR